MHGTTPKWFVGMVCLLSSPASSNENSFSPAHSCWCSEVSELPETYGRFMKVSPTECIVVPFLFGCNLDLRRRRCACNHCPASWAAVFTSVAKPQTVRLCVAIRLDGTRDIQDLPNMHPLQDQHPECGHVIHCDSGVFLRAYCIICMPCRDSSIRL